MAIEGTTSNHGTCPNIAISKGLEHNKTSVAATMSCIQQDDNQIQNSKTVLKNNNNQKQSEIDNERVKFELDKKDNTLSATGSKKAPKADPNLI